MCTLKESPGVPTLANSNISALIPGPPTEVPAAVANILFKGLSPASVPETSDGFKPSKFPSILLPLDELPESPDFDESPELLEAVALLLVLLPPDELPASPDFDESLPLLLEPP